MSLPDDAAVLVDRAEARAILGVSDATFARLLREGRFENMAYGSRSLYRSAELRAYRAQDKRLGGSLGSVTNAAAERSKSAPLRVTATPQNGAGTGEQPETGNDTRPRCEGCQRPFRPHRAGQRLCSPRCRKRLSRRVGKAAACAA